MYYKHIFIVINEAILYKMFLLNVPTLVQFMSFSSFFKSSNGKERKKTKRIHFLVATVESGLYAGRAPLGSSIANITDLRSWDIICRQLFPKLKKNIIKLCIY